MSILNAELHHLTAVVRKASRGTLEEVLLQTEVAQQIIRCQRLSIDEPAIQAAIEKGRTA